MRHFSATPCQYLFAHLRRLAGEIIAAGFATRGIRRRRLTGSINNASSVARYERWLIIDSYWRLQADIINWAKCIARRRWQCDASMPPGDEKYRFYRHHRAHGDVDWAQMTLYLTAPFYHAIWQ